MKKDFKLTVIDRALAAVAPVTSLKRIAARHAIHQFSYDAARITNQRGSAPQNINPNDYSKQRDRLQLMREAEDLENNCAPAKALNLKYSMYVAPISYHAQTGDQNLDRQVEQYLNEQAFKNCDVTGRFDFFRMLLFGVMGANRGGDYGWAFVRPGLQEGMSPEAISKLELKVQAVEPDRLGGLYQNVVKENYVAGITIGEYGEPLTYRVFRRALVVGQYTDPVDVPAAQFVHYTDGQRIDTYRTASKYATAIVHLRDFYETMEFLKAKQKLASALTVFTNSQGATIGSGGMDAYGISLPNNQAGLAQDIKYGQINHLPSGQDIKFPDTESPGTESQWMLTMMLKLCAMAFNLPYSFAIDASALGGVSTRLESEMAKAEFERARAVLEPHAHRIKDVLLLDALAKGIFPVSTIDKIFRGRFGYRPHPQPDIGKEAQASVSLFQNGLLNPLKFWVADGENPENVATDMAKWAVIKNKAAKAVGLSVEEVFGNGPIAPGTQSNDPASAKEPNAMQRFFFDFDPNEDRASDGKWTGGGGSSGSSDKKKDDSRHESDRGIVDGYDHEDPETWPLSPELISRAKVLKDSIDEKNDPQAEAEFEFLKKKADRVVQVLNDRSPEKESNGRDAEEAAKRDADEFASMTREEKIADFQTWPIKQQNDLNERRKENGSDPLPTKDWSSMTAGEASAEFKKLPPVVQDRLNRKRKAEGKEPFGK